MSGLCRQGGIQRRGMKGGMVNEFEVFKVVTRDRTGRLFSSSVRYDAWRVEYRIGEFATTTSQAAKQGYFPLAFSHESEAHYFLFYMLYTNGAIFRARAKGLVTPTPPMKILTRSGDMLELNAGTWPIGTVMVEEIMLVEEIALDYPSVARSVGGSGRVPFVLPPQHLYFGKQPRGGYV